jgi:hypothetical protein
MRETYINNHRGGTGDDYKDGAQTTALDAGALCSLDVTQ